MAPTRHDLRFVPSTQGLTGAAFELVQVSQDTQYLLWTLSPVLGLGYSASEGTDQLRAAPAGSGG